MLDRKTIIIQQHMMQPYIKRAKELGDMEVYTKLLNSLTELDLLLMEQKEENRK